MGLTIAKEKTLELRKRLFNEYEKNMPKIFNTHAHAMCKPEIQKDGLFVCCKTTTEVCDMTGRSHVEIDIGRFQYRNFHNIFRQINPVKIIRSGDLVLDIPSGYCQVGQFIWRNRIDARYVALDLDGNKLRHGQAFGWGSKWPVFVQHDMTKLLPLADNIFDVVNFQEGIEHIEQHKALTLLTDINCVLKKDGHLVISTPIRPGMGRKTDDFHIYEWGFNELKNTLRKHGFVVLKSFGFGPRKHVKTLEPLIDKYDILRSMRRFYPSSIFKSILVSEDTDEIKKYMSYQMHVCIKDRGLK